MRLTLIQALEGVTDAESKLSEAVAIHSPTVISEQMYRLGQYASALEKFLGDAEEDYEQVWARKYGEYLGTPINGKALSATAAKQAADVDCAPHKGNIKKLQRYVSAAWHVHMSCMARIKHLDQEMRGGI